MAELAAVMPPPDVCQEAGREGEPTLRIGATYLHSRYKPREEAKRLLDSAELDPARPVLVVGVGLGYHILELLDRGFRVAAAEPDRAIAALAVRGLLRDREVLLGVGEPDAIAASPLFQDFVRDTPQVFVHPPSARIQPAFAEAMTARVSRAALLGQRLRIAVVGPMFGGSLPIAGHLVRAFQKLGHQTVYADNSPAWNLYETMTASVKSRKPANQLGELLVHFLGEWSYARVMEFAPDICIVMAQAPVSPQFPLRLAPAGIVTAFWYVENWRHLPYWKEIAPLYDSFFHIQPGPFEIQLREAGCPHQACVLTGCDPEVHCPVTLEGPERDEFACDVSFAGAGYMNRNQLLAGLTDYALKVWGVNWTHPSLRPVLQRPNERFTPELFARIVAGSKINLNLHSSTSFPGVDPHCDAINPRVFEIAACGGFQLCDPCKGLDACFDFATELPVYTSLKELREKIDYFLAHSADRAQIAEAARERALREHTYEKRAAQMLELILDAHGARILRKGIRVQRTVAEIKDRCADDAALAAFLDTLPPEAVFDHETVNEHLPTAMMAHNRAEGLFAYLRELRNSAEALLDLRDTE
ncbi:MAG TPA: glycosyltransferase [Candidatus Hydrogenedentes bacterium]|nr:glycosyltransferase [Candidatus Hydrogenedentota bacterium]